jgi:manganese transport protein
MDPGNWATDLEGGARFGYQLLWVLVLSNVMALLLQTLAARLGIATGRDLAQICRERYPRVISTALWVLCEAAIAACDLAEVLGAAIGLKLLFGLPLLAGVVLTAADTLLVLSLSRFGVRALERTVLAMVALIGGCFAVQLWLVRPDAGAVLSGLVPRLNGESLYVAIGILGATVMPHNLYLHSALVQTRDIGTSAESRRMAARWNLLDSGIALNAALFVNAAILIVSAGAFHARGLEVSTIEQAHQLLAPVLGTSLAPALFAIALIAAGQSSTMTGTLAGQVVMEGFLNLRMRPWLRRLLTRAIVLVPAVAAIWTGGDESVYRLLILSQVILSLQLPFAVVPLIQAASERHRMGELVSPRWVTAAAWCMAALIAGLNGWLAARTLTPAWLTVAGLSLGLLLAYLVVEPLLQQRPVRHASVLPEAPAATGSISTDYRLVLVPLDHSDLDAVALDHACAIAKSQRARLLLLHVEEGVTSFVYGERAETAEETEGRRYLEQIVASLAESGLEAEARVEYGARPRDAIVQVCRKFHPGLIVMGAHGHRGVKDIVFGSTIDAVRHQVETPVLVVRR